MIATDHFVYIHVSRTGGTFLNKLILSEVPGSRMIQYHGQLRDLPEQFAHLPVIGFVRNPWDWYVSMFCDYQRKRQFVFQILSDRGTLDFEATVRRFLNLGDGSDLSKRLLQQLSRVAPKTINVRRPARNQLPGLCSDHFASYPSGVGYYTWLFHRMFDTPREQPIHYGRFDALRSETIRLFEETGTPISNNIRAYVEEAEPLNSSQRPSTFVGGYSPETEELVREKDRELIERFGFEFSEADKYPKADYYRHLGSVDVHALSERVANIPESAWEAENESKPNKIVQLNDTRHIMFRFITDAGNVFEFSDHPVLWDEWKDLLLPIMEQAAAKLGYSNYRFPRVMLARLPAGGQISPHSDGDASQYIHKIHVPLATNEGALFRVGGQETHMRVGDMVEVNNKRIHGVSNAGDTDRIHLIFECYNVDDYGKTA